MNTLQLLRANRAFPVPAVGVYPADRIPLRWPRPYALIINTDNHDRPGVHWVAVYLNKNGHAIFFDSYGMPPSVSHHHQRIRKNSTRFGWNTKRLQSFNSTVCGQYCVMFLYFMSHGYTLDHFYNLFSNNYKLNDNFVRQFFKKISNNRIINKKKKRRRNHNFILKGNDRKDEKFCIQSCRSKYSVM